MRGLEKLEESQRALRALAGELESNKLAAAQQMAELQVRRCCCVAVVDTFAGLMRGRTSCATGHLIVWLHQVALADANRRAESLGADLKAAEQRAADAALAAEAERQRLTEQQLAHVTVRALALRRAASLALPASP